MRYRAITRNREFSRVYARGRSYVHPLLVLYVMKNRLGHTRVGLTATKKVGGAVQRNRARRVMREAAFATLPYDVGGYDFIFVARGRTVHCKSTQLAPVAAGLLAQAGFGPGGVRIPPAPQQKKSVSKKNGKTVRQNTSRPAQNPDRPSVAAPAQTPQTETSVPAAVPSGRKENKSAAKPGAAAKT